MGQEKNFAKASNGHGTGDRAALAELGARLARERLRRNLTQEALAEEAGVSRATVRRLEAGHSTQLTNLVRILRALGLLENLVALAPEPAVRPLEALERARSERRRASSPRRATKRGKPQRGAGAGEPERPWKWGDDR